MAGFLRYDYFQKQIRKSENIVMFSLTSRDELFGDLDLDRWPIFTKKKK